MNYSIKMIPTAQIEVPSPEVYWMESFQEWTTLCFYIGILKWHDKIILINTGFPDDITELVKSWQNFLGERAILQRPEKGKMKAILKMENIDPDSVTHVIVTPLQLYATGNLHLFKNAKICISRKGWIEDIISPEFPHHIERKGCISDAHLSWLMIENNSNLLLLNDRHELLPGLTCQWVGAHHRSSLLVEIQNSSGTIGISDCAFHYSNIEEGRPLGIAESIIEAHAAYKYIRENMSTFVPLYDPLVQHRHENGIIAS